LLLSLVEIILEWSPHKIVIGDAPIQGCLWHLLLSNEFIKQINKLQNEYEITVEIKDFRRATFNPESNNPVKELNPMSEYVTFDLGRNSLLESITTDKNQFRVTNYNPNRMKEAHRTEMHKYCITKELFNADIVISVPKVKTHQKTGITCALKNIVGLNGDKDYLPHHRFGGTGFGGDCYPGKNYLRFLSEFLLDKANSNQGYHSYRLYILASSILWKLSRPGEMHRLDAGWHGNDTTWRMVLDLNKIVIYGKNDGTISEKPQRELYSLCDGIIGGQGNGPLNPHPLPLGILSFTNNSLLNDLCMAKLMRIDKNKIPLLSYPAFDFEGGNYRITMNGKDTNYEDLSSFSIEVTPPSGWIKYLKDNNDRNS